MAENSESRPSSGEWASETMKTVPAVVFYDGGCPLCWREVSHYRSLRGAETLRWVDITQDETALETYDLPLDGAMARFHVFGADGRWHIGAWGFVEPWSHLPAFKHLSRLLRTSGLVPVVDRLYGTFARWRLQRRCDAESCTVGGNT